MNTLLYWFIIFVVDIYLSTSFLLPHNAHRSLDGSEHHHKRLGNSMLLHRPGCFTLTHCIHKLKNLHNHSTAAVSLLGEPLNKEHIWTLLPPAVTGYPNVTSLIQLYNITDGVNYTDEEYELQELWLFPNYFLLSLSEALDLYLNFPRHSQPTHEITASGADKTVNSKDDFQLSWFPIMASGMGGYLFLNLSSGNIFEYSPFEAAGINGEGYIHESNVFELFKSVVEQFESGNFVIENMVAVGRKAQQREFNNIDNIVNLEHENTFNRDEEISLSNGNHQDNNNKEFDEDELRVLYEERAVLNEERRILNEERRVLNKERIILNQERRLINDERISLKGASNNRKRRHLRNSQHSETSQPHRKKHGTPSLHLKCLHIKTICDNIRVAIEEGNKPRHLCLLSDRQTIFTRGRAICGSIKRKRGYDCNSYPLLSTRQHHNTVMVVTTRQNNIFGAQLQKFYQTSELNNKRNYHNKCFKLIHP